MRNLLLVAGLSMAGVAGWNHLRVKDVPVAPQPMPQPTPVQPKPDVPKPMDGVIRGTSLEIVEGGKVKIVMAVKDGKPIAIVDDNGTARVIDLARVARLLK